jgi:flagellin-like hook-associated protein FlgL
MTRTQILQQATMAVLAQANQSPQMALQLLK